MPKPVKVWESVLKVEKVIGSVWECAKTWESMRKCAKSERKCAQSWESVLK